MRKRTFCGMILVFSILACLLYQERSYASKSVGKKYSKKRKKRVNRCQKSPVNMRKRRTKPRKSRMI